MSRTEIIAEEISQIMPTFLRHMYPYVFQPIDVPPSQVLAMVSIHEKRGCTLTELKKEMHVSAPTISGIIKRLERDGYIRRESNRQDRRVINVYLTKKGDGIVRQLRNNIKKRWSYILSRLPADMPEVVISMMRKMTQGFIDGTI